MRHRRRPGARGILLALSSRSRSSWVSASAVTRTALPGFARERLVADSDGRLYEEAIDTIERDYYRKIDRDALLNTSLVGRRRVAAGPVLALLLAEGVLELPARHRGPRSRASACPCSEVKDGPARRGGLRRLAGQGGRAEGGRHHRRRQRQVARGQDVGRVDRADQGPGGLDRARSKLKDGRKLTLKRAKVDIPIVQCEIEARPTARRSPGCAWRASRPARATTSRPRSRRSSRQGAKGVVLDLRHNGGGLLNEAVTVASVFLDDGRVVSTKGRARPERVYNAEGGAITRQDPGRRCSSTRARPRRRRSSPARCRTASGRRSSARARSARASSRRSSGCPTAARWTSPSASTSRRPAATWAAAACARAPGITPDIKASDDPEDGQGRGAAEGAGDGGRRVSVAPLVGVLDKHGACAVTPLFERGQPGQRRQAARAASASATSSSVVPGKGGRARVERRIGRPDVARDVLEALMVQRGLRRRFDPLVEREARIAASETEPGERVDFRGADHVHDRPADGARLRRRDLGRGARTTARCGCGCTSPTSRRSCGPARRWTARRSGARTRSTCPAWSSRCCPRRCRTAPARWCRARIG